MKLTLFWLSIAAALALGACAKDSGYHYTPPPPPSYLK